MCSITQQPEVIYEHFIVQTLIFSLQEHLILSVQSQPLNNIVLTYSAQLL